MCCIKFSDISVSFVQSSHSVSEKDGFVQPVLILNDPSSIMVTIHVFTTDGNAHGNCLVTTVSDHFVYVYVRILGNSDYNPGPYSIAFPAGNTNVTFNVTVTDDNVLEHDESFYLSISLPTTASKIRLGETTQTRITIENDDSELSLYNNLCISLP